MSNYNLNVAPRFYQFQGTAIPSGLTLTQGAKYLMGCGASTAQASTLSLHDRACGLAVRLANLVGQSGNSELIRKAEHEIQKWNDECEELFNQR
jgi:hypothetical protein